MSQTFETAINPIEEFPVEAPARLSGVDEMFAALNTELSCLNLLAFNQPYATLGRVGIMLANWQEGSTVGTTEVSYAAQRKNGERLERYKLLERLPAKKVRDGNIFNLTDRGIVASSLAGHFLELAYVHNINLSDLFGNVRRIHDDINEENLTLSPPLFRSLLLIATKNMGDTRGEVRSQDYPGLSGIADVELVDEIKVNHVEDLAAKSFLKRVKRQKMISGMPVKSYYYSVDPTKIDLVDELETIVRGVSIIDHNFPNFVQEGFVKSKRITNNPETVAMLLKRREIRAQPNYEIDNEDFLAIVDGLSRQENGFTTGELRMRLGNIHNLQYLSNMLTRLVNSGALTARRARSSNHRIFGPPTVAT